MDSGKDSLGISKQPMSREVAKRLIDLSKCVKFLELNNSLIRVKSEVDPVYELAGIARKFEGKKPVLFEKVKGSSFPVIIGTLWNRDIVGDIFNAPKEEVPFVVARAIGEWRANKKAYASPLVDKGPANEIIERAVDLDKLPIPLHAMRDGGRYLDSSIIIAKNPETGVANTSINRMMITKKDRLTFQIDPDRHLGDFVEIIEKRNESLPITINNGTGFAPWFASTLPRQGDGKYGIANHIVGQPIRFVKAQTVDVPAYADAQFVIEGEILPGAREEEGPFAEVSGYYGTAGTRWVIKVKAITHRKEAIFHSLLSGQEVWNAVGFTAEAKIFLTVKEKVPQVRAVYLDPGSCGFFGAVVQVDKDGGDVGTAAIMATFNAFEPLERVVVVDVDVNLYDPVDVNWAITTRFNADEDLVILKQQPGHVVSRMVRLDPDGRSGTVTKIGIDATAPYPKTERFERVRYKEVDLNDYQISY